MGGGPCSGDLSAAIWRPAARLAEVVKQRGKLMFRMGELVHSTWSGTPLAAH